MDLGLGRLDGRFSDVLDVTGATVLTADGGGFGRRFLENVIVFFMFKLLDWIGLVGLGVDLCWNVIRERGEIKWDS